LLAFPLVAGTAAWACGLSHVFSSSELAAVVITYQGDTVLTVGDTVPVDIAVTVGGAPVPHPRLEITSSNPTIVAVSVGRDTLAALAQGKDTLTVRLRSSILTDSAPTLIQPLRVRP
jgi:hypothetical protein